MVAEPGAKGRGGGAFGSWAFKGDQTYKVHISAVKSKLDPKLPYQPRSIPRV